ncbi:MAG TPA: bifunctional riboflavin kinase/FAD synthetase [Bacteroidota bacterium]
MIVARSAGAVAPDGNSVVTVGTFDGVHRGHRVILDRLVDDARQRGGRSVVVTFDPHPKSVVGTMGEPVRILTTVEERGRRLEEFGVDLMLVLPFTREFSRLSAEEFITAYLVRALGARHVVVGHDHHFGRGREGGVEELRRLGAVHGFTIEHVPAFELQGEVVSSSTIRAALAQGDIKQANDQLGYRYGFGGTVVEGDRRGASLGFPTANISPAHPDKMIPARGVYLVHAAFDGTARHGMMNIGVRPTVASGLQETREVHLLDFAGDLYGQPMEIEFLARLREERRFPSLDALVAQLERDRETSRALLRQFGYHPS